MADIIFIIFVILLFIDHYTFLVLFFYSYYNFRY